MKKRILALFLSVLLLAVMLGACGEQPAAEEITGGGFGPTDTTGTEGPVTGGELVVGLTCDVSSSLAPYGLTEELGEILYNVYEGLVKITPAGKVEEAGASRYSVSEDGLTYSFTLREDLLFHTGDPVTAEDVVYSFETCRKETTNPDLKAALSLVESVETDGKDGIVVTLKEPSADFMDYVSLVYIVPQDYTGQSTSPVGTGPFQFESRTRGESMILTRFADYWGEKAFLDQVTFRVFSGSSDLNSAVNMGLVDMVPHWTGGPMEPSDEEDAEEQEFITLESTRREVQVLCLNHESELFEDEGVRQAIRRAVDMDAILETLTDGHGEPLTTAIYPALTAYYDGSIEDGYGFSVNEAKSLLAEAGQGRGFSMNIAVPAGRDDLMKVGQKLADQLSKLRISARVQSVSWETWLEESGKTGEFDAYLTSYSVPVPSAAALLNPWRSDSKENLIGFADDEFDDLLDEANACTDSGEQKKLYQQAAALLPEKAAAVFLQDPVDYLLIRTDLEGYVFYPVSVMDLSGVHFAA